MVATKRPVLLTSLAAQTASTETGASRQPSTIRTVATTARQPKRRRPARRPRSPSGSFFWLSPGSATAGRGSPAVSDRVHLLPTSRGQACLLPLPPRHHAAGAASHCPPP